MRISPFEINQTLADIPPWYNKTWWWDRMALHIHYQPESMMRICNLPVDQIIAGVLLWNYTTCAQCAFKLIRGLAKLRCHDLQQVISIQICKLRSLSRICTDLIPKMKKDQNGKLKVEHCCTRLSVDMMLGLGTGSGWWPPTRDSTGAILSAVSRSKSLLITFLSSCNIPECYRKVFFASLYFFVVFWFLQCSNSMGFVDCICSNRQKWNSQQSNSSFLLALHVYHLICATKEL